MFANLWTPNIHFPIFIHKLKSMQKKLRKSADRKLFGVCGGIGEYLDIDPTVIRLGFIVAFFGLGTGLLLYIIMAIVMPD